MRWEKRKDRYGKPYYSFLQWDPIARKNLRLKRSEVPATIMTDSAATDFCRLREAEDEASKFRIQRKLAWNKKFYDFEKLLEIFETESKVRAPNSWQAPVYYLKQYALDFFLNHKQCNNLNNWPLFFEEFRDWLMTVDTGKRTKSDGLAYSSRNSVIGAVNLFLDVMARKGKCELPPKCRKFPRHLMNRRTAEDVISDDEAKIILQCLSDLDESGLAADFFLVLMHTGLRLGEGLGLSLADFSPGMPEVALIKGAVQRHGLKCFGYIALESQLASTIHPRKSDGTVPRKPLKGRKRIDAKGSRTIPVLDSEAFNALARRFNDQSELLESKKFGISKSDYLLFDGLEKNRFSRLLREAYEGTSFKHKSPHCARHTFATNLAGITQADTGFCRLVLGHKDEDTTLGYVHLFEQINRQARAKVLVKSKIALVD
ncbi:MAG: tyrosine-type recombinase/integrase [Bdellovibrionales bacterium]|nr:tyrosine-type recombinase/integrase [Bdellovibrionales bacterium]